MAPRTQDLSGKRFGRLTVLRRSPLKARDALWEAACDCGKATIVTSSNVRLGKSESCGCLRAEQNTPHGGARRGRKAPEYSVWSAMVQRCENPKCAAYRDYGARGIRVCERWRKYAHFIADMGPRPSPEMTLERINNDSGYEPRNCRWATRKEQNANQRPKRKREAQYGIKIEEL